jgi:hypothetical protein
MDDGCWIMDYGLWMMIMSDFVYLRNFGSARAFDFKHKGMAK